MTEDIPYQRPRVHLEGVKKSRQAWADLAYGMWELLRNAEAIEGQHDWEQQRAKLKERLTALEVEKAPIAQATDHGPGTWSPKPNFVGDVTLAEAVGQALGTASACWVGGTGSLEFDSVAATCVYDGLMAFLSDWADGIRREANEATAAKLVAKERWL